MKDTIMDRVKNLESRTSGYDRFDGMSFGEKQEIMRAYYSKMFNFEYILSKDEYEDNLLKRYPEVLGMKSEPPMLWDDKDIKDMTKKEKHEAIEAFLRHKAWKIAFKR